MSKSFITDHLNRQWAINGNGSTLIESKVSRKTTKPSKIVVETKSHIPYLVKVLSYLTSLKTCLKYLPDIAVMAMAVILIAYIFGYIK